MSTSNNRTEHGILPENIKSQLRSILPKSNNAGKGGISEGDILCKVRGFVAACRGLPTVQVLKLNFPNEIILSESIAGTGNYRYCLRDVTTNGNSSLEDRNGFQIDRIGLDGHSTESLGSTSATAVIPDTIQSTTNASNSKQLDNANRIASALRGGNKKTSTNYDNEIVVKKEPGISSEVSINNNSSQTVSSKQPTNNDACASFLKKTPIEYEHEKDTIETDHQSEAKTTELSEDIKAKILSILPTVGGGVEGVTLTSIKKKAPEFNNIRYLGHTHSQKLISPSSFLASTTGSEVYSKRICRIV